MGNEFDRSAAPLSDICAPSGEDLRPWLPTGLSDRVEWVTTPVRARVAPAIGLLLCLMAAGCSDDSTGDAAPTSSSAITSTTATSTTASDVGATTTVPTEPTPPSPSSLGFDGPALSAGLDLLAVADSNAHRIVVTRSGNTALDVSLWPSSDDVPHDLASLTKSVVSLVIGAAVERDDLDSLDSPLGDLLTLPPDSPVATSSLRELLRMRSGLDCSLEGGEPRLGAMIEAPDFIAAAASIPAAGTRGETFAYCSPGYHLVSAALTEQVGTSLADYADEVLFVPLGIDEFTWDADSQGITHGWGDLSLRATDVARIGELVLADGMWDGNRLLPAAWIDELRTAAPTDDPAVDYGMGWWLPTDVGAGTLEGIGRGGQHLLVWPEESLVVVVTGALVDGRLIARTIVAALDPSAAPSPESDATIAAAVERLGSPPFALETTAPVSPLPLDLVVPVAPNPLGLTSVRVTQATNDEVVVVTLTIGGRAFELPVALDGVGGVVIDAPTGAPVRAVGVWTGDRLVVDYEEVFGPEHWTIELDLTDGFAMTVTDLGGGFPPVIVTPAS